jgi:hypothetical protein
MGVGAFSCHLYLVWRGLRTPSVALILFTSHAGLCTLFSRGEGQSLTVNGYSSLYSRPQSHYYDNLFDILPALAYGGWRLLDVRCEKASTFKARKAQLPVWDGETISRNSDLEIFVWAPQSEIGYQPRMGTNFPLSPLCECRVRCPSALNPSSIRL